MSKYYGSWGVNGGQTFNGKPWPSNNFRKLRKELREAAEGNLTGPTSTGGWSIEDADGNLIAHGMVRW